MSIVSDTKTIVTRPTHLGRKPRTAAQLLRQTHAYLEEEGRWIRGAMFKDGDAKRAYENGFCGNWGVCSVGALGIVAGDFKPAVVVERWSSIFIDEDDHKDFWWQSEYETDNPLVAEACAYLCLVFDPKNTYELLADGLTTSGYDDVDEWVGNVISWNDSRRQRKQVLATFAKAAEIASRPGSFEKVARKHLIDTGVGDYTTYDPYGEGY